jgi:hypothetical protein
MLRRANEEAQEGGYVDYGTRLGRAIGPSAWARLEVAGCCKSPLPSSFDKRTALASSTAPETS